jgi:hypothetical protein
LAFTAPFVLMSRPEPRGKFVRHVGGGLKTARICRPSMRCSSGRRRCSMQHECNTTKKSFCSQLPSSHARIEYPHVSVRKKRRKSARSARQTDCVGRGSWIDDDDSPRSQQFSMKGRFLQIADDFRSGKSPARGAPRGSACRGFPLFGFGADL